MSWLARAIDRLLPRPCGLCGDDAEVPTWVCAACLAASPPPPPPVRACCGRPAASAACPCPATHGLIIDAATTYEPGSTNPAAIAIRALKYHGCTGLSGPLAALVAQRTTHRPAALLVPVPLHARRLRARGFNQAARLARALAALTGQATALRGLERVRDTPPQTGCSGRARRQALLGAFRARPHLLRGRPVVLIDDVSTTGATLVACTVALREAGVVPIRACVVARAGALSATATAR